MPEFAPWIIEVFKFSTIGGVLCAVFIFWTKSQDKKWEALFKEREAAAAAEQKARENAAAVEQKKWEMLLQERKTESEAEQKNRKREHEVWTGIREKEFKLLTDTISIVEKHTEALLELKSSINNGKACSLSQHTLGK